MNAYYIDYYQEGYGHVGSDVCYSDKFDFDGFAEQMRRNESDDSVVAYIYRGDEEIGFVRSDGTWY